MPEIVNLGGGVVARRYMVSRLKKTNHFPPIIPDNGIGNTNFMLGNHGLESVAGYHYQNLTKYNEANEVISLTTPVWQSVDPFPREHYDPTKDWLTGLTLQELEFNNPLTVEPTNSYHYDSINQWQLRALTELDFNPAYQMN